MLFIDSPNIVHILLGLCLYVKNINKSNCSISKQLTISIQLTVYNLISTLTPFVLNRSSSVIAIDINPERVKMAMNNAKVYGVANHVDFIVGDFFQLAPSLKVISL